MPRLIFKDGSIPTKEDLLADDLVKQMIDEAKAEVGKNAITKETVIQSLTVADIPEAVSSEIKKDLATKEAVIQSLTIEDVPAEIKQRIIDSSETVSPVVEKFAKTVIQAFTDDKAKVNLTDDKVKDSNAMQMFKRLSGN